MIQTRSFQNSRHQNGGLNIPKIETIPSISPEKSEAIHHSHDTTSTPKSDKTSLQFHLNPYINTQPHNTDANLKIRTEIQTQEVHQQFIHTTTRLNSNDNLEPQFNLSQIEQENEDDPITQETSNPLLNHPKQDSNTKKNIEHEITSTRLQNQKVSAYITQEKVTQDNITIVSMNVNGLQLDHNPQRLNQIVQWMNKDSIDVLLLQEINTNMGHKSVLPKIRNLLQKHQGTRIISAHTPYSTSTAYKPGGTAIILGSHIAKHTYDQIKDPIGRWVGVRLRWKGNQRLTILSTYQPPYTDSTQATTSFLTQQKRWYIDRQQTINPNQEDIQITEQQIRRLYREDLL
jgi:hypothetical protein